MNVSNEFKVEYLAVINISDGMFTTKSSINSYLNTCDKFEFSRDQTVITWNNINFNYKVFCDHTHNESDKFFHFILSTDDESNLPDFSSFIRDFRTVLYRVIDKKIGLQILWNDISLYYSNKAYPLIHTLENSMRKLLTKFMTINVGYNWYTDSLPENISVKSRNNSKSNKSISVLYDIDFKDLSSFLFDKYTTVSNSTLENYLKKIKNPTDIDLNLLKSYLPMSNWNRYFEAHVNIDGDKLASKWEKLYSFRNIIAHNNNLDSQAFQSIKSLIDELSPVICSAIQKLDSIELSNDDKNTLSKHFFESEGDLITIYLQSMEVFDHRLHNIFCALSSSNFNYSSTYVLNFIYQNNLISENSYHNATVLHNFREKLTLGVEMKFSDRAISSRVRILESLLHEFNTLILKLSQERKKRSITIFSNKNYDDFLSQLGSLDNFRLNHNTENITLDCVDPKNLFDTSIYDKISSSGFFFEDEITFIITKYEDNDSRCSLEITGFYYDVHPFLIPLNCDPIYILYNLLNNSINNSSVYTCAFNDINKEFLTAT